MRRMYIVESKIGNGQKARQAVYARSKFEARQLVTKGRGLQTVIVYSVGK